MPVDRQADAAAVYGDGMTETVGFKTGPRATARTGLVVKVRREPLDLSGGDDRGQPFEGRRAKSILVQLRNHATLGVLPTEVVPDESLVQVADPLGAATEAAGLRWRQVLRLVKQTPGHVVLEVQT